jgi:KDO2-lipid IV(A) lauroyltransferase
MGALTYLLYYLFIFPLSILPLRVLYGISDVLFVLIYHVAGYRKKIVFGNIRAAFPENSEKEVETIARKFYRHFCDIFFADNIKSFTHSRKEALRRLTIKNGEVFRDLYDRGKSVIVVCGHYGGFELFSVFPLYREYVHPMKAIYKVQKNKVADTLLYKARNKFGIELVAMEDVRKSFEEDRNRLNSIIFLGDQSPPNPRSAHWMTFLGQETGVLFGTEKMAKMYDYAVVFANMNRVSRGRYELEFQLVTDDPKSTAKGEITEKHTHLLEEVIRKEPAYWLWSHRRWKHQKPETTK